MNVSLLPLRWAALVLAGALAATPVLAKDDHGGKSGHKDDKHSEKDQRKADKKEDRREIRQGAYFEGRHRDSVHHYYTSYHGRCPPGLAKKDNGCRPRGQEKRWEVGHRLPSTVAVYTVPQPILVTLPPPPPRHKYVRVSGDILLIAIGTSMVIDGISGFR